MTDRAVPLTTVRGGINRLRTKGSAPNDSLYDLVNGYVSAAKTVIVRPGTPRVADLDTTTKGLVAFQGALHVFSDALVDVPDGYVLHIIAHPDVANIGPVAISEINYAFPFMGYIFVSATFETGETFSYWLQTGDEWQADTVYKLGDIVAPSVPNGLAFQAQRLTEPNPAWAPNVQRTIGDVIEPTVYNDFTYTVIDTQGANPRSGATEPVWPTEDGAQIFEDADGAAQTSPSTPSTPDQATTPAPDTVDRYDNIFSGQKLP